MTIKRYYSRIPGATFVHSNAAAEIGGTVRVFNYGFSDVEDPAHQRELDFLLGKNPLIYIPEVPTEPEPRSMLTGRTVAEEITATARSEAEIAAGEAALRGVLSQTQQEVGLGVNTLGVNESTIDQDLRNALTAVGGSPIGPGADRLATLRAEAALNTAQNTNI